MDFAQRLRKLRDKRGLTQSKLAREAGIAQPIIQRLEAGTRKVDDATVGMICKLARGLNVSVDYLLGSSLDDVQGRPAMAGTLEGTTAIAVETVAEAVSRMSVPNA